MVNFEDKEKIAAFDKIAAEYFNRNFGSMSKSDFETLLFSEYIEHLLNECDDADNYEKVTDYEISKDLGITQSRVRTLKERKELKYHRQSFDWKVNFRKCLENAKYDEDSHRLKFIVQDINVQNEIRHYIESKGWYDEFSLNRKIVTLPIGCVLDLFKDDIVFTEEAKEEIIAKCKAAPELQTKMDNFKVFFKEFTADSLKNLVHTLPKALLTTFLELTVPSAPIGICNTILKALHNM